MPMYSRATIHRHLICRGVRIEVGFQVKTWEETGYKFTGKPRKLTKFIVNHWTGAENPPSTVYNTLVKHRDSEGRVQPLTVHFVVDRNGVVFQMLDTDLLGSHCAGGIRHFSPNDFSIGIEFICRGSGLKMPQKGVSRLQRTAILHGQKVTYDMFTQKQLEMGVKLNEVLCTLYGLPLRVPETQFGTPLARVLTRDEAERFVGCAPHYAFEPNKYDCGLDLLEQIQARARELGGLSVG